MEISLPASMLDQFPTLAAEHPEWARVLDGISGIWVHREQARAALDEHPHRRFAHAALRRHVQMRDRHCVGVGCRRRAAATELDHTRDHAHGGPTISTNSGPNCPGHHTLKHQGGWTLTQPQAGHFIWTSPLKQTYHTRGEPLIPDLHAPRGALSYPQRSWEELEGRFLDPMAYLDAKARGNSSLVRHEAP